MKYTLCQFDCCCIIGGEHRYNFVLLESRLVDYVVYVCIL